MRNLQLKNEFSYRKSEIVTTKLLGTFGYFFSVDIKSECVHLPWLNFFIFCVNSSFDYFKFLNAVTSLKIIFKTFLSSVENRD